MHIRLAMLLVIFVAGFVSAQDSYAQSNVAREQPFLVRPFAPANADDWKGAGISYAPYRDGQRPGGVVPSKEEMREDLHILTKYWKVLRVYGSIECAPTICEIIREDRLELQVVVGAWIQAEAKRTEQGLAKNPEAAARNLQHVDNAILLANKYPDVVAAISVGNEALVFWSDHGIQAEQVIQFIRKVRKETRVPVTVADDYLFWANKKSQPVADELDFLITHIYAMWHGEQLGNAMAFTQEKYAAVTAAHPAKLVVIGEAGWATAKSDPKINDRAGRIRGVAGENEQAIFYKDFCDWTHEEKIPTFFFAAFDANWKGPKDPLDVEKHWGLFRVDRTPKPAMKSHRAP